MAEPGSASYRRPDDPDKTAHYATITDGEIRLKQIPTTGNHSLKKAKEFISTDKMMRTEIQDFMFFFGMQRPQENRWNKE